MSQPFRMQNLWASLRQVRNYGRSLLLRDSARDKPRHPVTTTGLSRRPPSRRSRRRVIQSSCATVAMVVILLTAVVGQRFYNEPKLAVGTTAPETFVARESASVQDEEATEERRKAAEVGSLKVLMIDQAKNQEILDSLQQLLRQGGDLRQMAGVFPFISVSTLSTETQQNLRQIEEWEWRRILADVTQTANRPSGDSDAASDASPADTSPADTSPATTPAPPVPPAPSTSQTNQIITLSMGDYRQAVRELQRIYQQSSSEEFKALTDTVTQARTQYQQALTALEQMGSLDSRSPYDAALLELSGSEWQSLRNTIQDIVQRMIAQGIATGTPDQVLTQAIRLQVEPLVPEASQPFVTRVIQQVLQPNLIEDPEQTRLAAQEAVQEVDPVIVAVDKGEVIVQEGENITREDFVLLDHFGWSRRGVNWPGFIGFGLAVAGAVTLFLWVEQVFHPGMRRRDYLLIFLLALSTPCLSAVGLEITTLPAVGLLVGSFYGSIMSVTLVGLLAILFPIGLSLPLIPLLTSASGGIVGGIIAGRLRSREELALLGGAVGLTQAAVYLVLTLTLSPGGSPIWLAILLNAGGYALTGLAWSIVALGISPYLEHMFDLVTAIRLAELSNPNRPLLQRLASEAPGTFQHTMFVATLAEAAARALGCNVELVRAGTLYHDIGKMHDPMGFIENQMGGPNKHDEINNPWHSARIIKKHVSEGIVMAKKCRLPKAVRAFIPEHQGTMLITYFYHQAKQQSEADPTIKLREADFRYDGPIPQSRETGIVMLADSCEAALRSLKDATPEDALAMVNRILRARWKDNQLVDSGLTRDEMSVIAEIFVRVWQQFNHQRIPYPKAALSPK